MNLCRLLIIALAIGLPFLSHARTERNVVDKVYHPYILPFERGFEWRFMSRKNDEGNALAQRFSFGHALSEYTIAEFYVVAARDRNDDFRVEGYEAEVRWMMTEQGRYWADLGTLFELEKKDRFNEWEATAGLLAEKEFGQTSLTVNALMVYAWGDIEDQELKSELRVKYRYRWMPQIQPAIELYTGDDFIGIGPAFMGIQRFDSRKQLKWELGFITGFNGDSKDHTLRFALEYEF